MGECCGSKLLESILSESPDRSKVLMYRSSQLTLAIALSFVLASCSGDDANDNAEPNTNPSAACASIEPLTASGQPLDALALSNEPMTPEVRDNLWFEYQYESGWSPGVIEGGLEPVMIVPVHPAGIEGGKLEIRFIDRLADSTCDGATAKSLDLTVLPLEPAPGELERYSAAYVDLLDTFVEAQGFTRQQLVDGPIEDVPIHIMPALVGWSATADPANPNSLEAVIQDDGPWSDLPNFSRDLELVEALFAKADVVEALETSSAEMAAYEWSNPVAFERVTVTPEEVPAGALIAADLLRVEIGDIGTLSEWMKFARKGDAMEKAANTVNTIATYLGLFPPFAAATNIAGLATAVIAELSKAIVELLPNELNGISLVGSPESYLEDQDRRGRIAKYEIVAKSGTWKFSQAFANLLIELIFFKLSSAGEAGDAARTAENSGAVEGTLKERVRSATKDGLGSLAETEATNAVKGKLKDLFDSLTTASIGPFRWGPFNLASTSTMVLEAEGPAVSVTGTSSEYESIAVGASTLTAYAKATEFPPFSNELSSALDLVIEVKEIQVDIQPAYGLVTPGESLDLTGIVTNAENDDLAWDASPGRIFPGADTTMATLEVPDDLPDNTRIVVTATSNSNTGLRTGQYRKGEREGTAIFYTNERVELTPGYTCVQGGSTVDFTATVAARPGNEDLSWDAPQGQLSVSPDGLTGSYMAPEADGTYVVTASLFSDPEVFDRSFVEVGDCACYFQGSIFGVGDFGGPNVAINQIAGTESISGDWPDLASQASFLALVAEGDGRYSLLITMPNGEVFGSRDEEYARMDARDDDGDFLGGTISGPVASVTDTSDPPTIYPAQIEFRGLVNPEFGGACLDLGRE